MSAADDRVDQIRARLAAATPGPWSADEKRPRWITTAAPIEIDEADWGPEGHTEYRLGTNADERAWKYADVTLIANAPADLAFLLAEREELLRRVEQEERAGAVKALRDAAYVARGMRPTTPELWGWWLDARASHIENGADL